MTHHARLFVFVLAMLWPAAGFAQVAPRSAEEHNPLNAWERGDIDGAERLASSRDDAFALSVRAHLAMMQGDLAGAESFVQAALASANSPEEINAASVVRARLEWRRGDWKTAEDILRKRLSASSSAHQVRLELGRILVQTGRISEAEAVLDAFSGFYNNNMLKTSIDLAALARAMQLLGSFQDANRAFQDAIDVDPKNADALIGWGFLLLNKYSSADAIATFKEALEARPNHPMALIGLARVELTLSANFVEVRDLLDRASMLAPGDPLLWQTHAEVAIVDADCTSARKYAARMLELETKSLEAYTIQATCDYLDDDLKGFEARVADVFALDPLYTRVLTETARFAVMVHRYDEAVVLNRRALKINPHDAKALLQLGIGLSRIGQEDEAQEVLKDAFDADPYNVRAFNMVELYEQVMPDYEFTEYQGFRIRAHRRENDVINAIMAPVVKDALKVYGAKYKHKTEPYLAVEVYPSSQTFGVRSVGLPHVSPHGICFGKVVVSRSPSDGNFNWRQVIWHELAHVYHIQLAQGRVPRWFTEGLAEYETNIMDPAWIRHHDVELSRALSAGELRGIETLDKGFTQAKTYEEVLRSYHQASLEIHYLVETYGFDAIGKMLRAWGASKSTDAVFLSVLSVTSAAYNQGFEAWLKRRYMNFFGQIRMPVSEHSASELEREAKKDPDDALVWAQLALVRIQSGELDPAEKALRNAAAASKRSPGADLIVAYILSQLGRARGAHEHGLKVLAAGRDSYELRVVLGDAALALENREEAEVHYTAAVQLWPDGVDAWIGLMKIARSKKDPKASLLALGRVFELNQNDPFTARLYTAAMLEDGDVAMAKRGAGRWVDVAPFDPRSHKAAAQAALLAGNDTDAEAAWKTLDVLRPKDTKRHVLEAITLANQYGRAALLTRLEARASKLGVPSQRVQDAKRKSK